MHLVGAGAVLHGELHGDELRHVALVELPLDLLLDAAVLVVPLLPWRHDDARQVGLGPVREHGAAVADVHGVHVGALDRKSVV